MDACVSHGRKIFIPFMTLSLATVLFSKVYSFICIVETKETEDPSSLYSPGDVLFVKAIPQIKWTPAHTIILIIIRLKLKSPEQFEDDFLEIFKDVVECLC